MALYFFGHANLIHVLYVTARQMPCANTWASRWTPECSSDAGQSSEFRRDRIAIVLGRKNRSRLRSDEQHGMSRCVIYMLFSFQLIEMLLDSSER